MTVIPFRSRAQVIRRTDPPDIGHLTRVYIRTGICLYLSPWMYWLNLLQDMDDKKP